MVKSTLWDPVICEIQATGCGRLFLFSRSSTMQFYGIVPCMYYSGLYCIVLMSLQSALAKEGGDDK